MHGIIKKKNTITHIWIQIILCLSRRYIHEFYSFFLLFFFFFFEYTHEFTLFYWFIYIRFFVFCTTLAHLEIKNIYR